MRFFFFLKNKIDCRTFLAPHMHKAVQYKIGYGSIFGSCIITRAEVEYLDYPSK